MFEKLIFIIFFIFKFFFEENMYSEVRIFKYLELKIMLDFVIVVFFMFSKDEVVKFSCCLKDEMSC